MAGIFRSTQIFFLTFLLLFIPACGGGGGGGNNPNPPPQQTNQAPTVGSFTAVVSSTNSLVYDLSWTISDADGDTLTCTIDLGDSSTAVVVSDCGATTQVSVNYSAAGDYSISFSVSDGSASGSASQDITVEATANNKPLPAVTAGENQLVIFYNRPDDTYDGWVLHLWNNGSCDSYAGPDTEWNNGMVLTGIDPNYGAYWVIELKDGHDDCANFIVHKGDEKDISQSDLIADLSGERMIWTLSTFGEVYTVATLYPQGAIIRYTAAHWADASTVFWDAGSDAVRIRIYSSDTNDMNYDSEAGIPGDNFLEFQLDTATTHASETLSLPRFGGLDAFVTTSPDVDKAKMMLRGKLLAIAYGADDSLVAATYVQTPRVLDALYSQATSEEIGLVYSGSDITANLWAPTATDVELVIYDAAKIEQDAIEMDRDDETGIWSATVSLDNDRAFYRYRMTVYHHQNLAFENVIVTDPYSVSLSTNGLYSQFVNLTDEDLKPMGWDNPTVQVIAEPEDAIILEGHIRDFSVLDQTVSEANRGKYLAFTESGSQPVMYLEELVDSGVTHFHMLPANDFATVDEDVSNQINLTNTVDELCAVNANSPVCGVADGGSTLLSVLEGYDPATTDAQALVESMRGLDGFNWGYDPKHFSVPDGSFASDADGVARIIEMRAMIQALHDMGLRVVLDVVYNHTNSSGLWDNSILDKVVPGYYHRRDLVTGNVENSTCCQDTAPEHQMMHKLMVDSLELWTEHYQFDGYRFDIMANNSKESILSARDAVAALDADTYFYGEGWDRADRGYEQANQWNMAGTEVGTFNDRPRDVIRDAVLSNGNTDLNNQDLIRLGLTGTIAAYELRDKNGTIRRGDTFSRASYAETPADIINYVSKHDNETLWDKLQYNLDANVSTEDRVRIQNIAGTLPLVSQGIPFFQLGGDLIRSKSMDRNSYDAGDWFNRIDYTKTMNNWNVGLPLAQDNQGAWSTISNLISNSNTTTMMTDVMFSSAVFSEFMQIRQSSRLFRLTSGQDVIDRVGFHNTGLGQTQGLIVMSIDDGTGLTDLDTSVDAIVVVINGTAEEQSRDVYTAEGFELHSIQQTSVDGVVQTASFTQAGDYGNFTVPARTTAVFVKPQSGAQGSGLSADATFNEPDPAPFGTATAYLRGSMNDWGNSGLGDADEFSYEGNGLYLLNYQLSAGTYEFKIASDNWADINLGFNEVTISGESIAISNNGGNMQITVATDGNYEFSLDASGATPVLTVLSKNTTVDCTALVDSSDPIPFSVEGGGQLYVRGNHSGWNPEEEFRLRYKGNNQYQAVANFDGAFQFKIASDDGSWTTQLWAQDESDSIITAPLEVGTTYNVAYENAGETNNNTDLPAGQYSFLLTLNEADPARGFNVGTLLIQQCEE